MSRWISSSASRVKYPATFFAFCRSRAPWRLSAMRAIENCVKRDSRKFSAVCQELLEQGISVRFRARGASMRPNIVEDDALLVAPALGSNVGRGDVVLTKNECGFRAHRVVEQNKITGAIVTRGDSGQENDEPTHVALGKVIATEREGRSRCAAGFSARVAARFNSTVHRLELSFWHRTARLLHYFFPVALLAVFCLIANVSPAAAQSSDLAISEVPGSGTVSPGANITYTIVVRN